MSPSAGHPRRDRTHEHTWLDTAPSAELEAQRKRRRAVLACQTCGLTATVTLSSAFALVACARCATSYTVGRGSPSFRLAVERAGLRPSVPWAQYPVRTCYASHDCEVCGKPITRGQRYRDGGYGKRAHLACADTRLARDRAASGGRT